MIYDSEKDEMDFFANSAAGSQGGAGIRASQNILDKGVEAVITPSCGSNAANVLTAAGVSIYMSNGDSLEKNIKDFQAGRLSLLEDIHKGFHRHGG
jgi:predicted Fe-Mo cluster-binding NifX family protein